jgi:hypothetical protein
MTDGKSEEEKNVERVKLIYDSIMNRYNFEWDKHKFLDEKASGLIGFVGIILALQGGIGAILIKDATIKGTFFMIMNEVFILGVLCLTLSIICGLIAYYIQECWALVPKAHYLTEECGAKDRSRIDIMCVMGQEMADSINFNSSTNNRKMNFIIGGFILLIIGLLLNLSFIIGVVIIMNY